MFAKIQYSTIEMTEIKLLEVIHIILQISLEEVYSTPLNPFYPSKQIAHHVVHSSPSLILFKTSRKKKNRFG